MRGLGSSQSVALSLPVIDAGPFFAARSLGLDTKPYEKHLGEEIKHACKSTGMFYLVGHNIRHQLMERVIAESARFFALSDEEKTSISCKKSPHFRGYGLLKNSRDWREQIHLGVEPGHRNEENPNAQYWGLEGPNQWPPIRTVEFKETALEYIDAIESLSRTVLTLIADALGKPSDFFTCRMKNNPYLLTKFMSYLPQEIGSEQIVRTGSETQMGVTAHCDWSWLTFLIQDNVGGLEAMDTAGTWHKVLPLEHALVINTGELLEIETGGLLRASPHRVINERIDRQRFSNAVFINPDLDAQIIPAEETAESASVPANTDAHVHKVIQPGTKLGAFVFGDSEWERKAEGKWCYQSSCLHPY